MRVLYITATIVKALCTVQWDDPDPILSAEEMELLSETHICLPEYAVARSFIHSIVELGHDALF